MGRAIYLLNKLLLLKLTLNICQCTDMGSRIQTPIVLWESGFGCPCLYIQPISYLSHNISKVMVGMIYDLCKIYFWNPIIGRFFISISIWQTNIKNLKYVIKTFSMWPFCNTIYFLGKHNTPLWGAPNFRQSQIL